MYAVFRSGGKQYRAAKGDVLRLEKIEADEGATVKFEEVLLVGEGSDVKVGSPLLSGGSVSGKVVRQGKSRKVPVVKFKRRQNYLRQGSHRQFFTEVEITAIAGASAKKAAPKAEAAESQPKRRPQQSQPRRRPQQEAGREEGCSEKGSSYKASRRETGREKGSQEEGSQKESR